MTSDRVNTGAKVFLKSLAIAEEGKERELIRFVVTYTGWLLLLFVWVIYLLSPELRTRWLWICAWLSVHLVYQVVLEVLSRAKKKFYETPEFRMARNQVMVFLGSALVLLTGGAQSYFWFVYLWPLFASALYFSWPVTWGIYGEVAVLYFFSSLAAVEGFASINFALLLTNLAVLLVLTAVLRYLIESIRQHQAAKRALRYSELLQQVQQDVDAAIDLQEVLDKILQRAVNLVGARDGALMLMEGDGRLHFHVRVGGLFPVGKEERTFTPGALDEGIAGWVARNRKPYVCRDTKIDRQFVEVIAGSVPIRSLVSVPIISHSTVLGVINVDSSEPDRFSAADAELLVTLANQVAVAIERAELLESLKQIGEKALGDAEYLHQHIVDAVHRFIRCPVAMWRVDKIGKQARIVASRNISTKYAQEAIVDLDRSVTGRAIREREIVQVLDIQADPDFQNKEEAAKEGWQSYLAVPLLAGPERAVGTLSIYSERKREQFTRWELDLLHTFAGQAGTVIRNADLVKELAVLNEIGRSVSARGVEAIANLVYQQTSQLMDTTNFFLCLYDKEKNKVDFKTWIYNEQPLEPFSRELSGLTSWIIREEKSLLIRDWDEEERDFPVKADIITERQRSWLGVPLLVGGEVLGVMSVQSPHPNAFDSDTQQTLETIANQAAVAIENARLFEETQNRLKLLNALHETSLDIVRPLNLGDLMPAIIERAADLMAGERHKGIGAAYWRCDHETQRAIIEYSVNPTFVGVELGFDEGLIGEVIRTGKAQYVNNYPEWPLRAAIFDREDLAGLIKNIVEIPVKEDGMVVAILAVSDASGQRLFGDADIELLERFEGLAAIAIQNARSFQELQRRIDELSVLNQIGETISSSATLEVDEILELLYNQAARLMDVANFYVAFYDAEDDMVSFRFAVDEGHRERVEEREGASRKSGNGLTEYVIRTKTPLLIPRDVEEWLHSHKVDSIGRLAKSWLGVPMIIREKVMGVIGVQSYEAENVYDEEHLSVLSTIASQAAIAIENARLFERIREQRDAQIKAIREISVSIADPLLLEQGLEGILDWTVSLMGEASLGEVRLLDRETDELVAEASRGDVISEKYRRIPVGEGITGWVAQHREAQMVPDVLKDDRYLPFLENTRSEIAVPMLRGDELIGVLNIEHPQVDAFVASDVKLAEAIAGLAVVAIENARLFQEVGDRAQTLKRLHEVGQSILTLPESGRALQELLTQIAYYALDELQADLVDLYKYNQAKGEFLLPPISVGKHISTTWAPPTEIFEDSLPAQIVSDGQPRYISHAQQEPSLTDPFPMRVSVLPRFAIREQIASVAAIPLNASGQSVGAMFVNHRTHQDFTPDQREAIELFANQAAMAIYNARAFEQAQARLQERIDDIRALQDIYALMGTASLEDMLGQIAEHAARLTPAKYTQVWLLDEQARELRFGAGGKVEKMWNRFEGMQGFPSLPLSEPSINARAALTRATCLCSDVEDDPYYKARYEDTRSELTTPLMHTGKVIGTLNLESTEVGAFTADHIRLVEALAGAAAVAIQNARLYEAVRTLNEMGRALTRGIELREDEVLELIRSQVSKLMNADNLYIALYDEATDTVRFGLAFVDGRRMDVESAEGWQPRRMGKGRTEWIIHHRRPILISTRAEGEAWYKQPGCDEHVVGDVAPSWLGVPMMMGDKVLGVIATYHPTWSYMYSEDDLDILQTMASQAAVAIENARLYADMELRVEERTRQLREAQEKALAAEVNAKVGLVAAEVAHHTKNLAGIIRCCAIRFQQQLQSLTLQQQEDLNNILLNSEGILKAAEDLFRPFGPEPEAKVSVDLMLREALDVLGKLRDINIRVNLAPDLPRVTVQVQKVTSYITELLNNAVRFTRKRMKERGIDREQIEVDGWLAEDGFIELTFTNHGPAIPREHWEEIFKLFSAREGEAQAPRSYGLGLWGARTTMRAHGGDVCILESNEERSTFLLRLPTQQQEG